MGGPRSHFGPVFPNPLIDLMGAGSGLRAGHDHVRRPRQTHSAWTLQCVSEAPCQSPRLRRSGVQAYIGLTALLFRGSLSAQRCAKSARRCCWLRRSLQPAAARRMPPLRRRLRIVDISGASAGDLLAAVGHRCGTHWTKVRRAGSPEIWPELASLGSDVDETWRQRRHLPRRGRAASSGAGRVVRGLAGSRPCT